MAQVLLTHSYHLPYDPKQLRKMQPYLPLGMLYAATALREGGISVAAFDSMLDDPSVKLKAMLKEQQPKIVAVYEDDFNFLSKMCLTRMRNVAWEIGRAAHESGAVTVVHGSDSTDNSELFLENGFDYVLCGEAEGTLFELCRSILNDEQVPLLDGMVKLDARGKPVRSPQRLSKNPQWSELPFPARDLIDIAPYREAWTKAHGIFSANLVASRGCPFHCNWCAKPISGNKFHLRPAAVVAEEMKLLKDCFKVQHIWFGDDVFALDRHWVQQLADEIAKRDARVPFKVQTRADLMNETTVDSLKKAGCAEVWMGVESGSQTVLDAMDKGLKLASVRSARRFLQEAGIRACFFLQFGYPGETWSELQQTIALVRETRPDDVGISFSYPLPGTLFYGRVQAQLGQKKNWTDSDDLCIMFKAAYKTDFYRAVRDALHAEVDSWRVPRTSHETSAKLDSLWDLVNKLEPVCRNPEAFAFEAIASAFAPSAFVPIAEVLPIGEN